MVIGVIRVRNDEARIGDAIRSLLPACDRVVVLDDYSEDRTVAVACEAGAEVIIGQRYVTGKADEAADRAQLWRRALAVGAGWVVSIDADERLMRPDLLRADIDAGDADGLRLRIVHLWDSDGLVRTDGIYGRFFRLSACRVQLEARFARGSGHANIHCGSVPTWPGMRTRRSRGWVLHDGYRSPSERAEKFYYYNCIDPGNKFEDGYRHVIAGDPGGPGAAERTRHAGPLRVLPIEEAKREFGLL